MITQQDIHSIEAATSVQDARAATMAVMFKGLTIDDRKAQIRAQVTMMGTKAQMVLLAWAQMLNQEGHRMPQTEKAYGGMAYKR